MQPCILWTKGKSPDGYGKVKIKGKTWRAHRHAWSLVHGEIPAGLRVLHHCDVPLCINVDHLFLGTTRDNWDDCVAKGRYHAARGEDHGHAKLTVEAVKEIRVSSLTGVQLAKKFGVGPMEISRIRRRQRWAWV